MSMRYAYAALLGLILVLPSRAAEPQLLKGHASLIYVMDFSRDGKLLVSVGGDSKARLWDTATGKSLREFEGNVSYWGVGISHDGKLVAIPQNDSTIHLYAAATGKVLHKLHGHLSVGYCVKFTPDGKMLATTAADGLVKLWDTSTGKQIMTLKHDKQPSAYYLDFADAKTLVIGNAEGSVTIWDLKTKVVKLHFRAETGGIWPIAVSPDGRTIATRVWQATTATLWETATGAKRDSFEVGGGSGGMMAFSGDGHHLVCSSAKAPVLRYLRTRASSVLDENWGGSVPAVAASADGRWIAIGNDAGGIALFDASKLPKPKRQLQPLKGEQVTSLLDDLSGTNGEKAFAAIHRLSDAPAEALPEFKKLLRPAEKVVDLDEKEILQLIKDLDAEKFGDREKAQKTLAQLGPRIVPYARKALTADPTPEARRRLEELLEKWDSTDSLSPHEIRLIRVLETLEKIGTPEARKILEETAKAHKGLWLGDEAQRVADRLR